MCNFLKIIKILLQLIKANNFNPLQVNHLLERDQDHGKYFHSKILVNHKVLEHQ